MVRRVAIAIGRLSRDRHVRELAGPGAVSLAIKVASAGLTYLTFVALARVMDVAEYGRFSFAFNLATFLCFVAGFGLHNAILRWLPEYEAAGRPDRQRGVFRWSLAVTGAGSAITVAVAVLAIVGAAAALGRPAVAPPGAMLLIVPLAFAELVAAALRTRGFVLWSAAPKDIAWRLAVLTWCAWLSATGRQVGAATAVGVMTASLAALAAAQLLVFARSSDRTVSGSEPPVVDGRHWVRTAVPIWIAGILISLIQYMDVVLVGALCGPVDTAVYFTAARTAGLMSLLLIASNLVCAPIISRMLHGGRRDELQRILRLNIIGIAVPTLAGLLVLVLFGRELLALFGDEYAPGYSALLILAAGYAVNALSGPMSYLLQIAGCEREYLRIMALCYAGVVSFQIAAIPLIGADGAALGSALGFVAWNFWSRRTAIRHIGVDPTVLALAGLRRSAG